MDEKKFYKKIHPNLFSDSKIVKKGKFSEEFFSYFLESLTSQSREKEFEKYCKGIAEVTVCPNLLPQTGPTGGGDSKVDSETFPVSETIAEGWLVGYSDSAYSERWAFAISAKKDWKPKFKSDVKKIIETNENLERGYKKIFFMTNQFVSDKKRAGAEDELRNEYGIDIRILDKTWLLNNTFKNDNKKIAIEAFNMSEDLYDTVDEGSKDKERKKALANIDQEFQNLEEIKPARIVKLSTEYIGILRELEVDKSTMINSLDRNLRLAKKYGSIKDNANAIYDYCWTIIWWYEDRDRYYELYLELEELYKEHPEYYSILKKLSTLWIILNSNHNKGKKIINKIENHTQFLIDSFQRFIQDTENPKRGKLAKFDYQMMRLQYPEIWDDIVQTYIEILSDLDFNNDIDLYQLKRVMELNILKECPHYDELLELLIDLLGKQSKNNESSQLLLKRGDDYFNSDVYKSIKFYSRALTKLFHENSKIDLIQTYMRLGRAFEEIGLLWSARSYYIRAFMNSANLNFFEGDAIPGLFLSARSLKYLELRLGRIEPSLKYNELELIGLEMYPYDTDEKVEMEIYTHYDTLLAIVLLNLTNKSIEQYTSFPDYLKKQGLEISSAALKYNLGYYDDNFVEAIGTKDSVDEYMKQLVEQPVSKYFQDKFSEENSSKKGKLKTKILGCNISVNFDNHSYLREFGSTILALFENIFATSVSNQIFPLLPEFIVNIEEKDGKEFGIEIKQNDNIINVYISNVSEIVEYSKRDLILEKLTIIVSIFIAQMFPYESEFKKIQNFVEDEETMFRTLYCSSTLDTFAVFDEDYRLFDRLENEKKYKLVRKNSLINKEYKIQEDLENMNQFNEIIYGKKPKDIDFLKLSHEHIQSSDVIYIPLWDKAGWRGLTVISDEKYEYPPVVGLLFDNKEGIDIFRKWKKEIKAEKITLGIITGINKTNPYWYRVIIGEDLIGSKIIEKNSIPRIFSQLTRLQTMEAKDHSNLNILKRSLEKHKTFYFSPVLLEDLKTNTLRKDLSILKSTKNIIIKDIVDIGEQDIFLLNGLMPTDQPYNKSGKEIFAEKVIKMKKNFIEGK